MEDHNLHATIQWLNAMGCSERTRGWRNYARNALTELATLRADNERLRELSGAVMTKLTSDGHGGGRDSDCGLCRCAADLRAALTAASKGGE